MDEDFEESLKLAILSKLPRVNHLVTEVTIGPNSVRKSSSDKSPVTSKPTTLKSSTNNGASGKSLAKKSPVIEQGLPTRQLLQLLDLERQEQVQSALKERLHRFEQFDKQQEERNKQSWLDSQQRLFDDVQRQEMSLVEANRQYEMTQASQHVQMAQLTEKAVERVKEKQQLLNREKQRHILANRVHSIKQNQEKYSSEFQQIVGSLKSLSNSSILKDNKEIDINSIKTIHGEFEKIIEKCRGNNVININDEDVEMSNKILAKIVALREQITTAIDVANENKKKELKKDEITQQKIEAPIILQPDVNSKPVQTSDKPPVEVAGDIADNVSDVMEQINSYISLSNLQMYEHVLSFKKSFKEKISLLENNPSLDVKTFKNDCRKAINISVNSLSDVNPEHILDKYRKLHSLLRGDIVIVGDKAVNASKHPQGIPFCTDLLARKFVMQGDTNVSSNPDSAFCYASVILSLWNDFSDFGMLLLGYFYEICPYLVPYYIPQGTDETDESYFRKRGYQYNNGDVEQHDKFLMRMAGIMKLYFALIIVKPKRGQESPYNLKVGWKWLASFLRLKPEIDITATALRVFLETVGFEMDARYGKQFQKILKIITQIFLPKCKEVKHIGGVLERLEELLNNYMKTGKFEKPSAYIDYAFW